jgi:phage-related minor tail protein
LVRRARGGGSAGAPILDAGGRGAYAKGGAFESGVQAFADGAAFTNGVVSSATMAPMAVFGEAGPEAIMPLKRGPNGSLGVQVVGTGGGGGSGGGVQVVQHISIDSRSDQATILQAMAQAKDAAIAQIQREVRSGSRAYTRA